MAKTPHPFEHSPERFARHRSQPRTILFGVLAGVFAIALVAWLFNYAAINDAVMSVQGSRSIAREFIAPVGAVGFAFLMLASLFAAVRGSVGWKRTGSGDPMRMLEFRADGGVEVAEAVREAFATGDPDQYTPFQSSSRGHVNTQVHLARGDEVAYVLVSYRERRRTHWLPTLEIDGEAFRLLNSLKARHWAEGYSRRRGL
ncbi:hypothetical protein [Humidisolicoccus flavus]|uniref:hypothetical protein n=1 Tax=Humidisolicoccus flavus TaxID=3111414 RepID=UPI003252022B